MLSVAALGALLLGVPQTAGPAASVTVDAAVAADVLDPDEALRVSSDLDLLEVQASREARVAPPADRTDTAPVPPSTTAAAPSTTAAAAEPMETASAGPESVSPTPGRVSSRASGLAWASGAYVPGSSPAEYAAFGVWRGRPLDVVVDWAARSTWADIENPDWLLDAWAGTPYTVALGMGMIPEDGSASLQACAAGAYTSHWQAFGRNIAASDLADRTVVRLGWEFNGDWYAWSAYDPDAYAGCWRSIVSAVERYAPGLRWDWTVNRGSSQSLDDPRDAWPGDAFVDVVGVDSYDMWPGVVDAADWDEHLNGQFGLQCWADFARAHGKQLSVPEWGVYPGPASSGANGGDNPFYVEQMVEFFRSVGPDLAYEAYFNEPASYIAASLVGPVQNPQAAEAYRASYAAA